MKKILTFLNHERYQVVAAIVCIAILISGICCQSRTQSLYFPERKVTREELKAEVGLFTARASSAYKELDQQDEGKAVMYDIVMLWTTTGTFNPVAIITLLFGLMGVGAITDNVRLRRDIKKNNNAGTGT